MKRSTKIAVAITAALGLGLGAAAAIAHPGAMGGMGPQMKGGMHTKGGMAHGPMGTQQADHAEIEKRAKEKGVTLPAPHGPHAGFGPFSGPADK